MTSSYILYPNKDLPCFLDKNNVDAAVQGSKLLSTLVAAGNGDIVTQTATADSTSTPSTSRRWAARSSASPSKVARSPSRSR